MQIRSYRRVFDLERRIYSVDRMRLNPSGVPVRGILYLLAAITAAILAARLPLLGAPVAALPWFARDVVVPAAVAGALTVVSVDGRAFHHTARSALVYLASPRRTIALRARSSTGRVWRPGEILLLPDGADPRARRFRYTGPGTVLVLVAHREERGDRRRPPRGRVRSHVRLAARRDARRLARGRVMGVDPGASLVVAVDRHHELP